MIVDFIVNVELLLLNYFMNYEIRNKIVIKS